MWWWPRSAHDRDERQGVASGLLITTQEVGAAVGFALMVAIASVVAGDAATPDATADGHRWAILAAALVAAVGAVLSGLVPRVQRTTPSRDLAPGGTRLPAPEAA